LSRYIGIIDEDALGKVKFKGFGLIDFELLVEFDKIGFYIRGIMLN
jgi:hypothetical protein